MLILIIVIFLTLAALLAQIFSRNKKKLNISSRKKFYNKLLGLVIILLTFCLFVPFTGYLAKLYACD